MSTKRLRLKPPSVSDHGLSEVSQSGVARVAAAPAGCGDHGTCRRPGAVRGSMPPQSISWPVGPTATVMDCGGIGHPRPVGHTGPSQPIRPHRLLTSCDTALTSAGGGSGPAESKPLDRPLACGRPYRAGRGALVPGVCPRARLRRDAACAPGSVRRRRFQRPGRSDPCLPSTFGVRHSTFFGFPAPTGRAARIDSLARRDGLAPLLTS